MNLATAMNSPLGSIIISVILGLGLAALFRTVCHGDGCMIVKAPDLNDLQKYVYRTGSSKGATCYKYSPEEVACPHDTDNKK
jgi:hypothetical protein